MKGRYKQEFYDKPFFKILYIPFTALLAFFAIMTGIQLGNLMYKLNLNLVEKIDSESFKYTISLSMPIIETVYNSGKSSVSFSGEIKNLFRKIFEFELDSPMTILNVQSPLFMSYYNHEYKSMLAPDSGGQQRQGAETPDTSEDSGTPRTGSGKGTGSTDGGAGLDGKNGETGKDADKAGEGAGKNQAGSDGDGAGKGTGKADEMGRPGQPGEGNTDPDGKNTDNNGEAAKPGENGNNPGSTAPRSSNPGGDLQQPISSITYEAEDEDEEDNGNLVALDKIVIRNFTKQKIDIAKLLQEPIDFNFSKKGPKVLIYHTHTSESYVLKTGDLGKKDVPSFNSNPKYNVIRVGEELARNLRKYGIETLHNGTVHDKKHEAAYGVSINTLQSYVKSYPSLKVYIDIHRDGLEMSKPKLRTAIKINGRNVAQIMFVMGTNDLLPNAHWQENLKFALKVQQKLNDKYPGLARPLWIVGKRYNQHVSDQAVLIEIGGDGNLLSETLESTKYLAEALNEVMNEK